MTHYKDGYQSIYLFYTDVDLPPDFENGYSKYQRFRKLTTSGKGELQTCFDESLGRTVVYKSLRPDLADNVRERRRFLREARIAAQLQHPNTVPVYEIGRDPQGSLYYTMKRVVGRNLFEILVSLYRQDADTVGAFPFDRLLDILIQACDALAYAHAHGVIHRDIKPENILVGQFGEVMLLDWGIAKVWGMPNEDRDAEVAMSDAELTAPGERPGTPLYMSPEQVLGNRYLDERTDVYSVGVVLYEMLTFSLPFQGRTLRASFEKIVSAKLEPPRTRAPGRQIPPAMEAICLKAMARSPHDRYQSIREMAHQIQDYRYPSTARSNP